MTEQFIPIRSHDLIDLLCSDRELKPQDGEQFRRFCQMVTATLHYEYERRLEQLKDAYAPFDPDRDTRAGGEAQRGGTAAAAQPPVQRFRLADGARQFQAPHLRGTGAGPARRQRLGHRNGRGLQRVRAHRPVCPRRFPTRSATRRRLRNFYRVEETMVPVFKRLVIILKMRKSKRLPKDVDTQSVYLKVFKDIPKQDVNMLLPGARVRMTKVDRGRIGVPLVTGLGMMFFRIIGQAWRALLDWGDDVVNVVLGSASANPWLMWIIATGALGYGYQSYYGYRQLKQRYHLTLTESLYYQNLDSNAGVLTRLLDEAEEQERCELLLAYYFLWRYAGAEAGAAPPWRTPSRRTWKDRAAAKSILRSAMPSPNWSGCRSFGPTAIAAAPC